MRHLIEIPASDVEAAGIAIDMALPSAWITAQSVDAEAQASTDGKLSARLSRTGRADIIVRGVVTAAVAVPCARCLKLTPVEVRGELSLLLKPNAALLKPKAAAPNAPARGAKIARAPRRALASPVKPEKVKAPRLVEYEFTAEEAEHDDYDGETIVLDAFVREAILLELPNFPLCSESCEGISPGLSTPRAQALGVTGSPSASAALPKKPNPFEALKGLSRDLPPGPEKGSVFEASSGEDGSANGVDESSHNLPSRRIDAGSAGRKKARGEAKIASTHTTPNRRVSPKKSSSRAQPGTKKTTKH